MSGTRRVLEAVLDGLRALQGESDSPESGDRFVEQVNAAILQVRRWEALEQAIALLVEWQGAGTQPLPESEERSWLVERVTRSVVVQGPGGAKPKRVRIVIESGSGAGDEGASYVTTVEGTDFLDAAQQAAQAIQGVS